MRATFIASLTALLVCFLLMASSYFQSIFWNVDRRPASRDRDTITFVHSVVGYLKYGSYTIDKGTHIRSTPAFDSVQDGHDAFRFSRARQEHGLPGAFLFFDSNYIGSKSVSIHYITIEVPILALSAFLYVLTARSRAAKSNQAEQTVAPNGSLPTTLNPTSPVLGPEDF